MKSWVDTVLKYDNNWLVLTFHGVDGVGWEALPHDLLQEYFEYITSHDDKLWIATFGDATKYMRERMDAKVDTKATDGKIEVNLTHSLDKSMYNFPLTLRTYVPSDWKQVRVMQGGKSQSVAVSNNGQGTFVLYQVLPNAGIAELSVIP